MGIENNLIELENDPNAIDMALAPEDEETSGAKGEGEEYEDDDMAGPYDKDPDDEDGDEDDIEEPFDDVDVN